jgi:hypothetical protein
MGDDDTLQATTVDYDRLEAALPQLRASYAAAGPFPHVVVDDVLVPEVFERAADEFPAMRDESWNGYLHVNETKYSNTRPETWGPTLNAIARELCSPRFVRLLVELTGIEDLIPDWSMDGGGLHQTLRGGHLNIHADFSTHHTHENWARRVNILLYLNREWYDEWGGKLELWDHDMTACQQRVTPAGNRMLVFTTSGDSFHGHPDGLTCPDDVARRSMALYYFTEEDHVVRRSTNYRARPDDGWRKLAIGADRLALDVYDRAKRRLGVPDEKVQAVMERLHRVRRKRGPAG